MTIDTLLARLDRPRRTGRDTWRAPCPAHGGENRDALGIRELGDGTVLLRCHAHGCSVAEIVAAVGLGLSDLFPPRLPDGQHYRPPARRPWHAEDILAAMRHEVGVVMVIAGDIARRGSVTDAERQRLLEVVARLNDAVEVARG